MAKIITKHVLIKVSKLVKEEGEIELPEGTVETLEAVASELFAGEAGAIVEVSSYEPVEYL